MLASLTDNSSFRTPNQGKHVTLCDLCGIVALPTVSKVVRIDGVKIDKDAVKNLELALKLAGVNLETCCTCLHCCSMPPIAFNVIYDALFKSIQHANRALD